MVLFLVLRSLWNAFVSFGMTKVSAVFPLSYSPSGRSHVVPGVMEALPGATGVRVGHGGVPGAGRAVSARVRGQVHL